MGPGRKKETAGQRLLSSRFFWHLISFFLSFFSLGGVLAAAAASGLAVFVISFFGMSFVCFVLFIIHFSLGDYSFLFPFFFFFFQLDLCTL
jgi:hypothetical protein